MGLLEARHRRVGLNYDSNDLTRTSKQLYSIVITDVAIQGIADAILVDTPVVYIELQIIIIILCNSRTYFLM